MSWIHRATTLATVVTVTATSLVGIGRAGYAADAEPVDRAAVVDMWQSGGDMLAAAAEEVLLGTDDEVRTFVNQAASLQALDDRIQVNRILSSGGPTVRAQSQAALDSGAVTAFLSSGWQAAAHTDERVRINQMLSGGGTQLKAAAQAALDADATNAPTVTSEEDTDEDPSGPLDTFLATGWQKPFELDQRLKVNQILSAAPAGSNVRRLAQRALDAREVNALTSFLDTQQAIAAARDEEASMIADLVGAAERASDHAVRLTDTAKEEGSKAAAAAAGARQSAQEAQDAMESAAGNAEKAAAAAKQAASAAKKAAQAAAQAMAAAQAAVSAARAAAAAASRAAAAAALTRDAANRANKAAADAAVDKTKGDAAKALAANALKCAKLSKDAAYVVGRAEEVAKSVIIVAQSATDASADAKRAAAATQDALAKARATGVNVAQAEAAATRARNQAARANRAATASLNFARAAVKSAGDARVAAVNAANDAIAAAQAANDAAAHAGDATKAAQASTNAANAASKAADDAVTAANNAYAVYDAARAVDAERLAVSTEEGAEAVRADSAAYREFQRQADWDSQEAAKRDADTNGLIAEVRDPATAWATAVADSRRVAMNLSISGGPNTQQEALTSLGGSDDDVVDFVRTRIDVVAVADDRATVATIVGTSASPGLRTAALAVLDGTPAEVAQFLRTQDYPERAVEDRVTANQILSQATKAGDSATIEQAQRALDGSDQDRHAFVTAGQFQSAEDDDRIRATRMISNEDSGPELKAAAQNALDGPVGTLHDFVTTGWYAAQQNDDDTAAHDQEMIALLLRASEAATTAVQSAGEAQAVAATSRGDSAAAQVWAQKANTAAQQAVGYATQADQSAQKAEKSAIRALDSAKSAAAAAKAANAAAGQATQSAAAARDSYRQARADANRAIDAGERARVSALAAGKNQVEALVIRNEAYAVANKHIEKERQAKLDAQHQQFAECLRNTLPGGERKCYEVYEPTDLRLGKATLNKAFCNKFAQTDSTYYQNCVADTFNPNFMANRALDILFAGVIVFAQWTTFAVAGEGLVALTAICAALCTAALGVLGGAEASMGIGGLFATWAEGSLMSYVAGGAWSSIAGGRLMGALEGTMNKIRIPAVYERVSLPQKTVDSNFARLISNRGLPSCVTKNSFVAGTPVLLADGTTKPIEDVEVGDEVLATDPASGATDARPVTDLITGYGQKDLIDIVVDTDGPRGDATGTITATANHPFWVPDLKEWRDAGDLVPRQWLRTSSGTWVQVAALSHRTRQTGVYNLTVGMRHTYYVVADGTPLLVHNDECGLELQDLGAGWFESPNHLLYGPGSEQGHRILHVLDHAHPNPQKTVHGIFDIGSQGVLEVIDEAWLLRDGAVALTKTSGNRTYYLVPMGRQIGTKGETYMFLLVRNGDEIITAYPKKTVSWAPDA